jgi:hypothetical protein
MWGNYQMAANPHRSSARRVPLWLKIAWTLLTIATFAAYLRYYSFPHSCLWFSSLALAITCAALWLESPLLISMQSVGVMALEFLYTLDFFARLLTGRFLVGLSYYFFQSEDSPIWVRAMSLFHLPLPFLLLWMVARLGYDRRGLAAQIVLAWTLLPFCYFFTDPADNVNWVFGPKGEWRFAWMPPWGWLVAEMIAFPLLIYLPSHLILQRLFRPTKGTE